MNRIAVTLVALGLSLASILSGCSREPATPISEIKKLGGNVTLDEKSPDEPVIAVDLQDRQVTDAGLVHLEGMTRLKRLNLYGTKITDSGLAHLEGLTQLQTLDLAYTTITDAGLVHLKGLTQLKSLSFQGTQVTDAGLVHLKGLTRLETLNPGCTTIVSVWRNAPCGAW